MNKVSENPLKNRTYTLDTSLMIVTGLFVTLYLTSNIMAVKVIIQKKILPIILPVKSLQVFLQSFSARTRPSHLK